MVYCMHERDIRLKHDIKAGHYSYLCFSEHGEPWWYWEVIGVNFPEKQP